MSSSIDDDLEGSFYIPPKNKPISFPNVPINKPQVLNMPVAPSKSINVTSTRDPLSYKKMEATTLNKIYEQQRMENDRQATNLDNRLRAIRNMHGKGKRKTSKRKRGGKHKKRKTRKHR